jgi:hypothetical protein
MNMSIGDQAMIGLELTDSGRQLFVRLCGRIVQLQPLFYSSDIVLFRDRRPTAFFLPVEI